MCVSTAAQKAAKVAELLVGNYLVVAQGSEQVFVSEYMLFRLSLLKAEASLVFALTKALCARHFL